MCAPVSRTVNPLTLVGEALQRCAKPGHVARTIFPGGGRRAAGGATGCRGGSGGGPGSGMGAAGIVTGGDGGGGGAGGTTGGSGGGDGGGGLGGCGEGTGVNGGEGGGLGEGGGGGVGGAAGHAPELPPAIAATAAALSANGHVMRSEMAPVKLGGVSVSLVPIAFPSALVPSYTTAGSAALDPHDATATPSW